MCLQHPKTFNQRMFLFATNFVIKQIWYGQVNIRLKRNDPSKNRINFKGYSYSFSSLIFSGRNQKYENKWGVGPTDMSDRRLGSMSWQKNTDYWAILGGLFYHFLYFFFNFFFLTNFLELVIIYIYYNNNYNIIYMTVRFLLNLENKFRF